MTQAAPSPGGSFDLLVEAAEPVFDQVFGYTRWHSRLRWLLFTLLAALTWVLMSLALTPTGEPASMPPGLADEQIGYVWATIRHALISESEKPYPLSELPREPLIFELPFRLLFRPTVFRHVLVAVFAFWLAFKVASQFMSELFSLHEPEIADHYLLQSALANPHNQVNIREGEVQPGQGDLPLIRIGGPGRVRIFLENAALFERNDGTPHVVGPTVKNSELVEHLDGFERLRSVVDLRDQKESFNVAGRSRDGIRVAAKDVQAVYSLRRKRFVQEPGGAAREEPLQPTYARPYPFDDPRAVLNLIYSQGLVPWTAAMGVAIRVELEMFFATHPLDEFLAMIEQPEMEKRRRNEAHLIEESQRLAMVDDPVDTPEAGSIPGIDYVSRHEITEDFVDEIENRNADRGLELHWLGVGTWDIPAASIAARHQEAWRITHESQSRRKDAILRKLRKDSREAEVLRIIQEELLGQYNQSLNEGKPNEEILEQLVSVYDNILRTAMELYPREVEELRQKRLTERSPARQAELDQEITELEQTIDRVTRVHFTLTRFTNRWAGGI